MSDRDTPPQFGGLFAQRRRKKAAGERTASNDDGVTPGVRVASAWSWRLLVIGGAVAVVIFLVVQLRLIVIPVLIAILIGALLIPYRDFLVRHRFPHWLAVTTAFLTFIVVVTGGLTLAVLQVVRQSHELREQTLSFVDGFRYWLTTAPFALTETQINNFISTLGASAQQDSHVLLSGALSVSSTLGHVLTGILLTLFCVLFILIDGRTIWRWMLRLFPANARSALSSAGTAGWATLRNFVKIQILVAFIDAVGIALGALILGLPLVIPIGVLVFLGSFIPVVGAVLTGALAVFIALVFKGWVFSLIMLGVVLLVQQIEGHVLQPLIMGTAVKVHPLAVVLSVAAGSLLAGISGALFAVPFVAVLNVMVHDISSGAWRKPRDKDDLPQPENAIWRTVPRSVGRSED